MDPWSSNEWVETADPAPSSKLPLDLDLQSSSEHVSFHSSQPSWPVPDFNLPSWDNPSPPKSNSPITTTPSLGGPDKLVAESTSADLAIHSRSKQEEITPTIQTLTIGTRPNSPANSFRTAGSVSSDQWAESNQSPLNEQAMPSHQFVGGVTTADMASSTTSDSISADRSHPTSDPDDVRWDPFTQPISSTISFQPDLTTHFPAESPTQSGWNGETNLSGWDSGTAAIDHSLPSLGASISITHQAEEDVDPNQSDKGWSSPHFSDNDGGIQQNGLEPVWDQLESHSSSATPGKHQLADQQGPQEPSLDKPQEFLPSGKAGLLMDPSSTLSSADQLVTSTEPYQDPLHDTSATRTENSFQNPSTSDVFQTAISKTTQAAANVLKSANKPRRFFANVGTHSSTSQHSSTDSTSPPNPKSASDKVVWRYFSALEAPPSNAVASEEAPVQQQSVEKPRTGFFRLWTSKASPLPKASESKDEGGSSILSPDKVVSSSLPRQNFSHQAKDSISSASTSSTVWPAPSPPSADSTQAPATSAMSRLFGRFGTRSSTTSINTPIMDDQSAFTAPSTELDANEAKILDFFQTVPIEPQTQQDDNLPSSKNITQHKLSEKNQKIISQSDAFDFLSDNYATSNLMASMGYGQPPSSQLSSGLKGIDPFDFINSSNSSNFSMQRHSSQDSVTSSGFQPFLSHPNPLPSSASHSKNKLKKSTSGEDLDDIFSAFQGPSISTSAQGTRHSANNLFDEPSQASNRMSTYNVSSSAKAIPKPLMNNSSTFQGTTQVRMTSSRRVPALTPNSDMIETASSKIPILPPPPSSRSNVFGSVSLISPSQNEVPTLSPPAFSSSDKSSNPIALISKSQNKVPNLSPLASSSGKTPSPIPLIPPPQNNVNTSMQKPLSNISHAQHTFFTNNSTKQNSHVPVHAGKNLTKEDLNFFDSLI